MSESRRQLFERGAANGLKKGLFTKAEVEELNALALEYRDATGQWPGQNIDNNFVGSDDGIVTETATPEELSRLRDAARRAQDATRRFAARTGIDCRLSPTEMDAFAAEQGLRTLRIARSPERIETLLADMMWTAAGISRENEQNIVDMAGDETTMLLIQAEALWAKYSFPFIRINDPIYAASLCATSMPPELASFMVPPWPAYRIALPYGIGLADGRRLTIHCGNGVREEVARVMVVNATDRKWVIIAQSETLVAHLAGFDSEQLCEPLGEELNVITDPGMFLDDDDRKTMRLVSRIVLSICLDFDRAKAKMSPKRIRNSTASSGRMPDPILRRYTLGRAVTVDARGYVSEYLSGSRGERGPVNVRSWVRGHWKQQPCGVGHKERKFIQIEPYPRGPENAPQVVRPHVLKDSSLTSR